MRIEQPEGQKLEYKLKWSDTAKKTMIAFANDLGGLLLFGVADDGEIVGCNYDEVERQVMTFAREGVEPSMVDLVIIQKKQFGDKVIASVMISTGQAKPYSFRGKTLTNGGVYIRLGGQTVAATLDEIFNIVQRSGTRSWESKACFEEELSFDETKAILDSYAVPFDQPHWLGYGLTTSQGRLTNLALILSDQNPFELVVTTFDRHQNVSYSERIKGSILHQLQRIDHITSEINGSYIEKVPGSLASKNILPWPPVALREALTNSLAHRDFNSPMQASVNIFHDKITIITPGGIPIELTLEEALITGASFCRNPKLADMLMRLHWMERLGTGFSDIFRDYAPFDAKPKLNHIGRTFVIELPKVIAEKRTSREEDILSILDQNPLGKSRKEVQDLMGLSRPSVMKYLNKMIEDKIITTHGTGRATKYFRNTTQH